MSLFGCGVVIGQWTSAATGAGRRRQAWLGYTTGMPSMADDFRAALRERVAAMSIDERLALTARLAESDLELFCAARGMEREEGRRLLVERRQAGRLPSRVMRGETE